MSPAAANRAARAVSLEVAMARKDRVVASPAAVAATRAPAEPGLAKVQTVAPVMA